MFQWEIGRGKYYIDGPNDGYPVEDEKLGDVFVRTTD
jgi:hypothetical protein